MLEVSNLEAGYGPIQVLHGVSLQVGAGEVVALIGANGAGKTTALLTISGLLRARAGSILFDGREIAGLPPHVIARRGLVQVPEGRQLFAGMTVLENLRMGAYASRGDAEARRLRDVFDLFPMLGDHRAQTVGSLSGGQQQMVAIARALMSQPKLLMLDEPSLGLDPRTTSTVFSVVRGVREMHVSVLIVEQNAVQTLRLADRAYVLESGEIRLSGQPAELLENPALRTAYLGL
jgi:branched-chain amino acid transport system ATP-binding protein